MQIRGVPLYYNSGSNLSDDNVDVPPVQLVNQHKDTVMYSVAESQGDLDPNAMAFKTYSHFRVWPTVPCMYRPLETVTYSLPQQERLRGRATYTAYTVHTHSKNVPCQECIMYVCNVQYL